MIDLMRKHRKNVSGNLSPPSSFKEDVAGDTMKITGRRANVGFADLGKTITDPVHYLVGQSFRVAETFGNENPNQTLVYKVVLLAGSFTV